MLVDKFGSQHPYKSKVRWHDSSAGEANGDRQILGAHWPVSLAKLMSTRLRERSWSEDEIVWIANRVCSDVMKSIMNFRWYEGDNEKT